jgi:hypothetical protein
MTIGNVARSSVTLIVPTVQIGNVDTGTATLTSGQYNGTANPPVSGVNGSWPLSTIWSAGSTNMLGGRAYISAADTSTATLKYFLPTTLSIDPGQVLRVALETL